MRAMDLQEEELVDFYKNYVALAAEDDFLVLLKKSSEEFVSFIRSIPRAKLEYVYMEGKWTIKEVLLHLIDAERVFQYRALRFARQDNTNLPGFDEGLYVQTSGANRRSLPSLLAEFMAVRSSSVNLFESFDEEALHCIGHANSFPMSVRATAFVIVGHQRHHMKVIKERYLN